jgi:hypothetical protein
MMDDNEMYVMLLLLKVKIAENHNDPQKSYNDENDDVADHGKMMMLLLMLIMMKHLDDAAA